VSDSRNEGGLRERLSRLRDGLALRVVDLFSGCGGWSLGFQRAGFTIAGGLDIDRKAALSYERNIMGRKERCCAARPIEEWPPARYAREVLAAETGNGDVDVLIGGPPCQAFARVGRAKLGKVGGDRRAFLSDGRAGLYKHFLEYVAHFQPLAVALENVPDIMNYGGENVAEAIAVSLEELGFRVRYTVLNAVHYGVPQYRQRWYLIGLANCLGTIPSFPVPRCRADLPEGYRHDRAFLTKLAKAAGRTHYVSSPDVPTGAGDAVTSEEALRDLPQITRHLSEARPSQDYDEELPYREGTKPSAYGLEMRNWPGLRPSSAVRHHIIRLLPRDYRLFAAMAAGDEYPRAHSLAVEMFSKELNRIEGQTGITIEPGSEAYLRLLQAYVPPYDPAKFPNKWRKLEPDRPSRTLTAHLGKDTYSHIHYDSAQARVISVREAARLQSFPDAFVFTGPMNAAYAQIGNSVPPLQAYAIAVSIRDQIMGAAGVSLNG